METNLLSRYIFIDTSLYESNNFHFHEYALGRLKDLCSDHKLYLLMNSIVDEEIKAHLKEKAHVATRNIKKIKSDVRIIRNLPEIPHYQIFQKLHPDEIEFRLMEKYQEFKEEAVWEFIDIDLAKTSEVAKLYFQSTPPFSNKKKHEFPDAIMLISLREWAIKSDNHIYILSNDSDMEYFCKTTEGRLKYLSNLDELINQVYNTEEDLKDLTKFAKERYAECTHEIFNQLNESINNAGYTTNSVFFEFDGEIEDIETSNLSIESVNIIGAERDSSEFSLSIQYIVDAWHSYPDDERSVWDPEDKVYIHLGKTNLHIRHIVKCKAHVWIIYKDGLPTNTEIYEASLEDLNIELIPEDGEEIVTGDIDQNI